MIIPTENRSLIIIILIALIAILLLANEISFLLLALTICFILMLMPAKVNFALFIIALLTITSNVGFILRTIVQVVCIGALLFFYFKSYGIDFRNYKRIPKLLVCYIVILFFTMSVSVAFSSYPWAGLELLGRTLLFFLLAYIIYSQIYSEKDVVIIYSSVLIAGLILTLSTITEYVFAGSELINVIAHSYTRSSGLMKNVNAIGGIIANIAPLLFAFLFYDKLNRMWRVILVVVLLIVLTGELLTTSRASFISIIISIFLILFVMKRNLLKWAFSLLILLYLIYLFYTPLNEAITLLLRIEQGLAGREVFWDLSLNIIKDNFLFGIGPGAYKYLAINYIPVLLDSWRGHTITGVMEMTGGTNSSHNMYLLFFSDMGVLGFLTSLLLPVIFFKLTLPLLNFYKRRNELKYTISVATIAMGAGAFIRCLFMEMGIVNYGYITTDLPFWITFGLLVHFYQTDFKDHNYQENIF